MVAKNLLINEQVILDPKGKPEYVVLPVARYAQIMQLLEDFGLGQAILQAEDSPRHNKLEALARLEEDDN